jgi:hypothetical protein
VTPEAFIDCKLIGRKLNRRVRIPSSETVLDKWDTQTDGRMTLCCQYIA